MKDVKIQLKSLPRDLQTTYERLLCKSEKPGDLRTFLQWAALSARPITVEELAEAIAVNFQPEGRPFYDVNCIYMDPRDALTECSGFVIAFEGTLSPQVLLPL